jgi:hypothetical protein
MAFATGAKRSVLYAFLPIGSRATACTHYLRIGYHASKHSDGSRTRLGTRFNGLNSVREVLLLIEVDSEKLDEVMDRVKMRIQGPGTINTVSIKFHETFKAAYRLGHAWFETKLPLADIRAVFYELAEDICSDASSQANAQSLAPRAKPPRLPNLAAVVETLSAPRGF